MNNELIYQLGETLLLELDGVDNVTYPKGQPDPDSLIISMDEGNQYEVIMKKIA